MRGWISIIFGLIAGQLMAVPAYRGPIIRTMDDGTEKTVFLHGNEHYHYMTDTEGRWLDEKSLEPLSGERLARSKERLAVSEERLAMRSAKAATGDQPNLSPRGLLIMVDFQDTKFTTPAETIDSMLNGRSFERSYSYSSSSVFGSTIYVPITAKGSVWQYFHDQSYGQYNPVFDVIGPVTISQKASYYGQNDSRGNEYYTYEMIREACEEADKTGVDFRQYDSDNDGTVDFVYVLYAGYGEADSAIDSVVWPHQSDLTGFNYRHDGKYIGRYACGNELSFSSKKYAGIGVFCHEFSHVLGLPDLYHTGYGSGPHTLGTWDVMDDGAYNNDGNTPPAYSAYERFYMGWLTPRVLTDPEFITLQPINEENGASLLVCSEGSHNLVGWDPSPTLFYLLENRKKEGWDQYLPGSGLLITKINYNAIRWRNNRVNRDENTMGVDLQEARANTGSTAKASDAFPSGAKEWTAVEGCEVTGISREATAGLVSFSYRGADVWEGIENIQNAGSGIQKILRNGQLIIVRGDKQYDITGRRL